MCPGVERLPGVARAKDEEGEPLASPGPSCACQTALRSGEGDTGRRSVCLASVLSGRGPASKHTRQSVRKASKAGVISSKQEPRLDSDGQPIRKSRAKAAPNVFTGPASERSPQSKVRIQHDSGLQPTFETDSATRSAGDSAPPIQTSCPAHAPLFLPPPPPRSALNSSILHLSCALRRSGSCEKAGATTFRSYFAPPPPPIHLLPFSGPHLPSSFRTIPVPYPTTPKRDLPMLVPTTDNDDDRRRRRRCARARPISAAPRSATARGVLRPSRPIRRRTKPTCSLAALRLRLRLACERASGASENGPFADSGPGRPLPACGGGGEKRSVVEAGGASASGRFRKVRGMRRGRDWEGREGREGTGRWDWTSRDTGIPSLGSMRGKLFGAVLCRPPLVRPGKPENEACVAQRAEGGFTGSRAPRQTPEGWGGGVRTMMRRRSASSRRRRRTNGRRGWESGEQGEREREGEG